jgi:hypothetical protein
MASTIRKGDVVVHRKSGRRGFATDTREPSGFGETQWIEVYYPNQLGYPDQSGKLWVMPEFLERLPATAENEFQDSMFSNG